MTVLSADLSISRSDTLGTTLLGEFAPNQTCTIVHDGQIELLSGVVFSLPLSGMATIKALLISVSGGYVNVTLDNDGDTIVFPCDDFLLLVGVEFTAVSVQAVGACSVDYALGGI